MGAHQRWGASISVGYKKGSMVIIYKDNRDKDQKDQSMVGSFPQRAGGAVMAKKGPL